ncbi:MAG TPA: ATP-binding protein [Anaerolineaceae bacterium]
MANSAYLRLTAFSLDELMEKPVSVLGEAIDLNRISSEEDLQVLLNRRKRTPLSTRAKLRGVDSSGKTLVMLVHTGVDEKQADKYQEAIFRTFLDLAQLTDSEIEDALSRGIQIIRTFLEVEKVLLYKADSESPRLVLVTPEEEPRLFPDEIPSLDLVRLFETTIWQSGKKVQAEIQRVGRINNFSFLATTPLGKKGSLSGLMVIADSQKPIPPNLKTIIEALAAQFQNTIDQHILIHNLRTEVKNLNQQAKDQSHIIENSREGIILISPDLKIVRINPAAEWILGYVDDEVRGQPVENILIGSERLIPALTQAAQGIAAHNIHKAFLHRRHGQSFSAQISVIPILTDKVVTGITVFIADTSENEEIRARALQLEQNASIGEVMYVFAHDVRNPINNISMGLQLLSSRLSEDNENQGLIQSLEQDFSRLNDVMESVLVFARIGNYRFEPLNIGEFLQRIIDRWRPRFIKSNIFANLTIEKEGLVVYADPRALDRVFVNFINNSIEAIGSKGGNIGIHVAPHFVIPDRPQVKISVSDDGPGIPPHIINRIFEPFITTKDHGTGLGLAITKRIILGHYGSIDVNSVPGATVFQVILPLHEGDLG